MRFEVEWLEAPGVRDCVLAATWARLRISIDGAEVTELIHLASETRRGAVYGPVFPLVEWLVDHWWAILYEPALTRPLLPGRGAPVWKRDWVKRHNLLAAREGTALPDAAFVRDGDDIVIRWDAEPKAQGQSRVRFVGEGQARVDADAFRAEATHFIEATLERAAAVVGDDEDLRRVTAVWGAIQTTNAEEHEVCRSLALLGLDPYDPDEATDTLVELVTELAVSLPPTLRDDLLEGSRPTTLRPAASWLNQSRAVLASGTAIHRYARLESTCAPSAHQAGYQLARRTRAHLLQLSEAAPISDLEGLLVDRLDWDSTPLRPGTRLQYLDGLIGLSRESEKPVVVDPGARTGAARRFLLARSAFFTVTGAVDQGRLLTRAVTRPQRGARAFAAELLAPASAIAQRVGGLVSQEEVADLAEEFEVSPLLIQHQIENHGLGAITG